VDAAVSAVKLQKMAQTDAKPTESRGSGESAAINPRTVAGLENGGEIFFSTADTASRVHRAVAAGRARKIGPRLYTSNMSDDEAAIVQRNVWPIVEGYFPDALVVDRTALQYRPAEDGSVFVAASRTRPVELPGLRIVPRPPAPVHNDDRPFMGGLRLSSEPRALLDNMRPSRARRGVRRTLSQEELEEHLDHLISQRGEAGLNEVRDKARALAGELELREEFRALDRLVGSLLNTREGELQSRRGRARQAGRPYDDRRVELFGALADHLLTLAPVFRDPPASHDPPAFAFYEAYFSNFIEGTELPLDLAEEIIFHGVIPDVQPEDAHDIRGTYQLVSDPLQSRRVPHDGEALVELLRDQHAVLLAGRPGANPGQFKTKPSRAGTYDFVSPIEVEGTLLEGYRRYAALPEGFPRAVYAVFLVSEVHPFVDGNGRMARVLMNSELSAAGQQRVLVPTIFRNNYLQALRALSRNGNPVPLPRVLDFAQRYGRAIDFSSVLTARRDLDSTHAFLDANEAEDAGIRLRLPAPEEATP
jgi:Fic/DOC family